jgi:hypothetical protein
MPSDYAAIKRENELRFGTDIGRIGQMLLADRYGDRTHFIFELLQNTEDALARRKHREGARSVTFKLSASVLTVSHFGAPFSEADVRSICGIAESTKDFTAIGRFGIGFKSVYAFTDCPEIHSGDEHFTIESFVWPKAVAHVPAEADQTTIILPMRSNDESARMEIELGLRRLGPRVLLFLRELDEVVWSIEGGGWGQYLRIEREPIADEAHRVMLIGEEAGATDVEEAWLVFSREVKRDARTVGAVELGFALDSAKPRPGAIRQLDDSALVAFFPTIVATNLGFLLQGPYRTTPSRDNVPRQDAWNQHLVDETAVLLVEALSILRNLGYLTSAALRSLPLDRTKFGEGTMFAPLFQAVKQAMSAQPLLPGYGGGHIAGASARLARTQELRDLFDPNQLGEVTAASSEMNGQTEDQDLGADQHRLGWLSEDITQDRLPEVRAYVMRELGVPELIWESILPGLTPTFLQARSDAWITKLYEVLNGQPALLRAGKLAEVPLVRLEGGSHVVAFKHETPQAFLPGPVTTGFPTVSGKVLATLDARAFLQRLGLTEPDPVDDVIRNILPNYGADAGVTPPGYAGDIQRILNAFHTDSKSRREALIAALADSPFLAAVDTADRRPRLARPKEVYVATQRLQELFDGVSSVLIVDDTQDCLRGEAVRELLEASGASRYLETQPTPSRLSEDDLADMRRSAGWAKTTGGDSADDSTIRGLERLLDVMASLDPVSLARRSRTLWEALCDLHDRRGAGAFTGTYEWFYHTWHTQEFDAYFLDLLNRREWVLDGEGRLSRPGQVVFDALTPPWTSNPFLLAKIHFKPAVLEMLAREAGIETGVLELLKLLGLTSEAELKSRLGLTDEVVSDRTDRGSDSGDPISPASRVNGKTTEEDQAASDLGPDSVQDADGVRDTSYAASRAHTVGQGSQNQASVEPSRSSQNSTASTSRPFISYVAVDQEQDEPDPDGIDHQERLELEARAIDRILKQEPLLQRTPLNNPGFDLIEPNAVGRPKRWIEVKAMTGTLESRPVGVSRTQFVAAQQYGDQYWLYVVENAASDTDFRIVRIRDPAGRARTFTFDRGWATLGGEDAGS